jgi:putative autotransporter adhesin-like protein
LGLNRQNIQNHLVSLSSQKPVMRQIFLLAVATTILFSSCREIFAKRIRGNGNIITQSRTAANFNTVHLSGGNIDVYASQDSTPGIKVVTDENLQEYVEIESNGGVMRIHPREGFNLKSRDRIKVYVASPNYREFESSGAGNVYSEGKITSSEKINFNLSGSTDIKMDVDAPAVQAHLSGAGNIMLQGQTKDLDVSVSGSADIKCFDLKAENVKVEISGAGDAEVFASVKLDAHVSGAGDVRYRGNPQISQSISGAGSIKKVE